MAQVFDLDEPVGRIEELTAADGLLRATLADVATHAPHARALLVGGDAGIGKTTLVHAVGSRGQQLGLGFAVGHCLDLATGLPFGPVVEALQARARELSDDADLPASAGWLAGDRTSAVAVTLDTLLDAAQSLARIAPFVLVLEDLHWADESVRNWAIAMVRTCRAPLLLALTFRTEELTRHHPFRPVLVELSRSPGTLRLDLRGLDAAAVAELAQRRLNRDVERRTIDSLVRRSEGNPLFVEELLDEADGVPMLLQDLLLRHVDRLADGPRRLAQLAAVGGTIVDVDVLEDASELEPRQFTTALQQLLDGNVITRRAGTFAFRHALLREAIREDMLPVQLVQMHAAWARALRARVESGSAAQRWQHGAALALHAYAAHDLALAFDACVWAGLAGRQYGAAAAADHFERALELWERIPDPAGRSGLARTDLPVLAATVLANEGVPDRVHTLLRRAVELVPADGDPLAACRVYTAVVRSHRQPPGVLDQADALERAIALAGTSPSRERSEAHLAGAFHMAKKYQAGAALRFAEQSLDTAVKVDAADLIPEALWAQSDSLWWLGRCDEGLAIFHDAVREADKADLPGTAIEAAGELAWNLLVRGRIEDALGLARQARVRAQDAGLTRLVAYAAEQEVEWLIADGQFAAAERLFEDACLPGGQTYRDSWLRSSLLLARGEGMEALTLEEDHAAGDFPSIEQSTRLLMASEMVGDISGLLRKAEALLAQLAATDSPLLLALAAAHGFHARVLASVAGLDASGDLVRLADAALATARDHASSQWNDSLYGMHLSVATAHQEHLAGRPTVMEWRRATSLAVRFGRYTALRPRLELARSLLQEGDRSEGRELLVDTWHEARAMGAGWIEEQAARAARRSRIALPLDRGGPGPLNRLTPREREVLDLVATGATDRAIAVSLFITEKTASAHVGHVLTKLGVANRGQAAAVARSATQDEQS